MRIGFDAKRIFHNTSGLGNYGRDLVRILAQYYPQNKYLLYNPKPKKVNRLKIENNISEILPSAKIWKIFSSFWRQGAIIEQLKNDGVEIYHGLTGEIPRGIEKTKIKTIVTIHDLIFVRFPKLYSFFDRKIHFRKAKFSTKNADKIIAISEQTKKDIVEYLKVNPNKIEVIYQGCHESFKKEHTSEFKKSVVETYHLPENFILNVGAINERKNILSLIKAIENIDTTLVVVGGKTSYYKKVKKYIDTCKLNDKIVFLENVNMQELSAIYQMATIFVYPSIFEGFGIPIIEALYSKTPVITSTGSCFSEAGGPDSIYVNPKDIKELRNQIQGLLENEEKRNEMIEKGFEFVQKFNDEDIANYIVKLYNEL